MSCIWTKCCDNLVDLDYNCDDVIYYNDEYYCIDHLSEKLVEEFNLTDDELDQYIDFILEHETTPDLYNMYNIIKRKVL